MASGAVNLSIKQITKTADQNVHRPGLFAPLFLRVATVRENILENKKKSQVREKSGNFIFSQGNLEKMKKVMEKSGKIKVFPKKLLVNRWASGNFIFHKLQAIIEAEFF